MFCSSEVVVDVVDVVVVELKCLFETTLRRERDDRRRIRSSGACAIQGKAQRHALTHTYTHALTHTHAQTHTHLRTHTHTSTYTHEPSFLPPSVCEGV